MHSTVVSRFKYHLDLFIISFSKESLHLFLDLRLNEVILKQQHSLYRDNMTGTKIYLYMWKQPMTVSAWSWSCRVSALGGPLHDDRTQTQHLQVFICSVREALTHNLKAETDRRTALTETLHHHVISSEDCCHAQTQSIMDPSKHPVAAVLCLTAS